MKGSTATVLALVAISLLAGCVDMAPPAPRRPADVRAQIVRLLPAATRDKEGWATDIYAAFASLGIEPSEQNLCAALAVTEQESTFTTDPVVPGLAKIARAEIDRRAARLRVPQILVRVALRRTSPDGKTWGERIDAVRTEQAMSHVFEDFIDTVPMGKRLFSGANPVRTGGPMQVSIAFAEQHLGEHAYPYPMESLRQEVFSRRGGMYFGIAHLLGYPASYAKPLYRFADFNAGWYASRNAAFQQAVSAASGIPLSIDGDLVNHDGGNDSQPGKTELAVRSLAAPLGMTDAQIRRALRQSDSLGFESTPLYQRVFAMTEETERRLLPRAVIPNIALESPKITRKLTTEWFATRVDNRYQRCMVRAMER